MKPRTIFCRFTTNTAFTLLFLALTSCGLGKDNQNTNPIANAGPDQTVIVGENVTLNGNGSLDSNGSIVSYQWLQKSGIPVNLTNANSVTTSFIAPNVQQVSSFTFQLRIVDNSGATATDSVVININPPASIPAPSPAPIANAGPDLSVIEGATVTLSGSGSSDSDGNIVSYQWTRLGGLSVTLQSANLVTASFVAPPVTQPTSVTIRLTIIDNDGNSANDETIVTVNPAPTANIPPVANAGTTQFVTSGANVTLNGSNSTDSDGIITAYQWIQTSGAQVNLSTPNNASTSFVAPMVLQNTTLTFQLTVTDNTSVSSTASVTITITPASTANIPPVANPGPAQSVSSGVNVTLNGSNSTDSDGTINAYLWTQTGGTSVTLNNPGTATASFVAPTVQQISTLTFQLTVTDNTNVSNTASVAITINPAATTNIPPVANPGPTQSVSSGANVTLNGSNSTDSDGTINAYLWIQTGGASVTLSNPGTATTSFVAPTVQQITTLTFQLTVTDNASVSNTASVVITVNPSAINTAPVADAGLDENVNRNTLITLDGSNSSDSDGFIQSYLWQQTAGISVTLSGVNTQTAQFTSPPDVISPTALTFTLTVTDNAGASTTSLPVTITVYPPQILSGQITAAAGSMLDSDTNSDLSIPESNNTAANAQRLSNPVTLGGYVNRAGQGAAGKSFTTGDINDYFHVTVSTAQVITLYVGNPVPGVNELGLYLLDELNQQVVALSVSGSAVETVTVPAAGNYFINVRAEVGASNYVISVGASTLAVQSSGWSLTDDFVPGEIIVKYKDFPTAPNTLAVSAATIGLQAKAGAPGRNMLMDLGTAANKTIAFATLAVTDTNLTTSDPALQAKLDTLLAAAALRQRTDIESVGLNYKLYPTIVPNDPNYNSQWHYPLINLPQAWDITTGNSNVIVAVVDTGVLLNHPDLAGKLVAGFDFIRSNSNSGDNQPGIDNDPYDVGDGGGVSASSFHGTHVSGTIAASTNNGIGVAGVAWGVSIMPVRVIGINGATSYDVEQGIRFAAGLPNDSGTVPQQPADVINLSLGGPTNTTTPPTAYRLARDAGVIIVAAAGNNASNANFAPAAYTGVVSVSAVTISKQLAGYSNFGSTIDVAAPGGSSGNAILSTGGNDSSGTIQLIYNTKIGTSMAAPHVAGVVALMKSVLPTLTPAQFDTMLINGLLTQDLGTAGRDDSFGYGLIDAAKAVQAAANAGSPVIPPNPPVLSVSPTTINLGSIQLSSSLSVINNGGGTLTVISVTNTSGGWLSIAPTSVDNSGLGTYTLNVNRSGLPDGIYTTNATFATSAGNQVVSVTMQVLSLATSVDAGPQIIELLDANTSARADLLDANATNGVYNFSFTSVYLGQYTLRSSSDLDNDGIFCELGESCGGYPILDNTVSNIITVDGNTNTSNFNFETGFSTNLPAQAK